MIRAALVILLGVTLLPAAIATASSSPEPLADDERFFNSFITTEPFHLILVEKDHQRLKVLKNSNRGLQVIADFFCATGKNRGQKSKSGDSRTPEGIYFVNKIFNDDKITVFGRKALHLDYPNIFDKQAGHNGDGIYIHGTNRKLKSFSTNGCITLRNRDLEKMVGFLQADLTPIIIVPGLQDLTENEPVRLGENSSARARDLVLPEGVNSGRIEFTALYRLNYGPRLVVVGSYIHNRQNLSRLKGYSRTYLRPGQGETWEEIHNIRDSEPMHFKLALRSPEPVRSSSPAQEGKRPPRTSREETAVSPEPERQKHEAGREPEGYPKNKQEIFRFVENWRQAWQDKDLDSYIGSYAGSFKRGNQDLDDYRRYKKQLNRRYEFIRVRIDDLKVTWTEDGANVSFHQIYNSDQYHAEGRKVLQLVYKDQEWKIERELWIAD